MLYAAVLLIILVTLLGVALYKVRSVKKQADFLVAGRSLSWPVLVFTLLSSWIGAGSRRAWTCPCRSGGRCSACAA